MSNHSLKFLIFLFLIIFTSQKHDSFVNECGLYNGIEDPVLMPTLNDCIKDKDETPRGGNQKCCLVEGEKDLYQRSACVLVVDEEESRIKLIEEMSEIATKLRVDCGSEKVFKSDCGVDNPSSQGDCKLDYNSETDKCCFIKIDSPQFSGYACRKFTNININTIGEAVVAAKTVGATLEVLCNWGGTYLNDKGFFRFVLLMATLFLA